MTQEEWNEFVIKEMLPEAQMNVNRDKPPIVCLCGSTRFMEEFIEYQTLFTLRGYIVLTVAVCKHEEAKNNSGHGGEEISQEIADMLDKLHLHKIDIADHIYVINKGGYIGESTRKEIRYAEHLRKPVQYLEELK